MDRERHGRLGRRLLGLLILNLLVASAGLGLEYWRNQPRTLPAFNADKVELKGIGEPGKFVAGQERGGNAPADYIPPDP